MAAEAKQAGLVDKIAPYDEVLAELKRLSGKQDKDRDFPQIELATYVQVPSDPQKGKNRIAILYAEGEIVDGDGGPGLIGGDKLSRELRRCHVDRRPLALGPRDQLALRSLGLELRQQFRCCLGGNRHLDARRRHQLDASPVETVDPHPGLGAGAQLRQDVRDLGVQPAAPVVGAATEIGEGEFVLRPDRIDGRGSPLSLIHILTLPTSDLV